MKKSQRALFSAWTWWLGPAVEDKRPRLWPSSAPSWGTLQALILLCQPLSTPAHYTTYWETSGVYLGTKMGQYLCGMWNNNNALWEYYRGAEKGAGLFIRNKSFVVLPACVENLWRYFSFRFCRENGRVDWSVEKTFVQVLLQPLTGKQYNYMCTTCVTFMQHYMCFFIFPVPSPWQWLVGL